MNIAAICNPLHTINPGYPVMFDAPTPFVNLGQTCGVSSKGPHHLSVDRVSVVIDIPEDERAYLYASVIALEKQECGTFQDLGIKRGQRGDYKAAVSILMPGDEIHPWRSFGVLLQVAPRKSSAKNYCRIEFNPNRTGPDALARVQDLCAACAVGIELPLSFATATVTRLDFAADIHGPILDDYLIESLKKRTRTLYTKDGGLQTQYLGRNRQNFVCIYDKRAEQGMSLGTPPWMRIEVRCKPFVPFVDLYAIKSPFTSLRVFDVLNAGLPLGNADTRAFLDSCQKRGLRNAVRFRSSGQRSAFTKAVRAAVPDWWDPLSLWKQWPGALQAAFGAYALLVQAPKQPGGQGATDCNQLQSFGLPGFGTTAMPPADFSESYPNEGSN